MEERIAGRICSFCCRDESGEEQEIIQYGITLLTESLLKTAALLFFGACIGKFWECLGFLAVFCSIRSNAGGIHCKTNAGCFAVMFLLFAAGMAADFFGISRGMCTVVYILSVCVCLCLAPSATENNPIADPKIRRKKKAVCVGWLTIWYMQLLFSSAPE